MKQYNEIFKLKKMLDDANITYNWREKSYIDSNSYYLGIVGTEFVLCDAIQNKYSIGNKDDLLEIKGGLTEKEMEIDEILGNVTAEDAFERFKYCYENKTSIYVEKE